jgi:glyoxylase-like metal-dependent hydrolase (beta-lactamase superfamily II)
MDAKLLLSTEQSGEGYYIAQYKTSELAVFSYYVESKGEAVLIDPILDTTVYEQVLAQRHASLKYVLLSHYHADYLSGHAHLKVPVVLGPGGTRQVNKFKVKECPDGHLLSLGVIKLRLIHTPGHTPESSCYVLVDSTGKDQVIFSGDTVFLGDVGRPDLACSGSLTSEDLAGWLYDSIQKLKKLDGAMRIYPGHGSGSACGKSIGAGMFCTLGAQFTNNYGFKAPTKNDFTKEVLNSMPKPPPYFFHDAALNQSGPEDFNFTRKHVHTPLHPNEFNTLRKSAKLVDTRMDVGKGVLHGAYWLPSGAPITSWISLFFAPDQ